MSIVKAKYIVVGAVALLIIFLGGIGLYTLADQDEATTTLGVESIISNMAPAEFDQAIKSGEYELIDVRTAEEFQAGHLANAFQVDFYQGLINID